MTRRRALPILSIVAAVAIAPAAAHEFKLESLINSFVKLEADRAHLVIRLPLHLTRTIKLPVKGASIDLANAGPGLEKVLAGIAHDVTIYEDGRPLTPSSAAGRFSLPSDRSFETYETAAEHVARPQELDSDV